MSELCGVPSLSLGTCDMPAGHDGDMHGSAGDGFYARCGKCRKNLKSGDHYVPNDPKKTWIGYICGSCK